MSNVDFIVADVLDQPVNTTTDMSRPGAGVVALILSGLADGRADAVGVQALLSQGSNSEAVQAGSGQFAPAERVVVVDSGQVMPAAPSALSGAVSMSNCRQAEMPMVAPRLSESIRPGRSNADAAGHSRVPPKLYRIGEVVEYAGVSRQTVHNYTTMGLLREARWTPGGHRLYDETVFGRLDRISRLKAQNKTMEEIRKVLAGTNSQ